MISKMLFLAEVTMDGKPSYPSIIPPLLVIAGVILAVVVGAKRFASGPKTARVIYWSLLGIITVTYVCLMVFRA